MNNNKNSELSQDEEEQILRNIATRIHKRGLDSTAVLFLESSMPLAWIAGELSRVFVSPFLSVFTDDISTTDKLISLFEQRSNLDKLMRMLEALEDEDRKKKNENKLKK